MSQDNNVSFQLFVAIAIKYLSKQVHGWSTLVIVIVIVHTFNTSALENLQQSNKKYRKYILFPKKYVNSLGETDRKQNWHL